MRYAALATALAPIVCATVVAQTPDLSGTWKLDVNASEMSGGRDSGRRDGSGGGAAFRFNADTLVISQSANELRIVQQTGERQETVTYRLDGKSSTNRIGQTSMTSTSRWVEGVLVTEGRQLISTARSTVRTTVKQTHAVSADGKVLTMVTTRAMPRGPAVDKLVYVKVVQ